MFIWHQISWGECASGAEGQSPCFETKNAPVSRGVSFWQTAYFVMISGPITAFGSTVDSHGT